MRIRLLILSVLAFYFQGCGYTLNHRLKEVFVNAKGIFVPVFSNGTEELGVEMIFTNALIRELGLHGDVVLTSKSKSGLELRGVIENIAYAPNAFFAPDPDRRKNLLQNYSQIPDQIGVSVTINLQLIESDSKKVLWTRRTTANRTVSAPLDRTGDQQAASTFGMITQSLIESRYTNLARDLMRDMYDDMVEIF